MPTPRKPSLFDWSFCGVIFLLGAGLLGMFVCDNTPAESELTLAAGVPSDVSQSTGQTRARTRYLCFTVAGYRTEYASDRAHYAEVLAAVASGEPLQIGISTKQVTKFGQPGLVRLYKVSAANQPILTYAEVVAHNAEGARAVLIVGSVIGGLGTFGIASCFRNYRRYLIWTAAGAADGPLDVLPVDVPLPERSAVRPSLVLSLLVYAIVIGVNFDPKVQAVQVKAFGAEPLGLPVLLVVALVETFLYLPMPWVFWHGMRITLQALHDGRRVGVGYLLTVGSSHPQLRRSQWVCLGGLLYFAVICGVWIAYAESLGL